MSKKSAKRPHEMTTHEAMEHLFTPEGAKHAKRIVSSEDEGSEDNENNDRTTE